MENQTPTGLKQLFQSMCPQGTSVIEGTIISISPLKITLANDAKMILGENSLIVPRHLAEYAITIDIPGAGLWNERIMVHNSLKPGETVYLMVFHDGKKYFVLDRKG